MENFSEKKPMSELDRAIKERNEALNIANSSIPDASGKINEELLKDFYTKELKFTYLLMIHEDKGQEIDEDIKKYGISNLYNNAIEYISSHISDKEEFVDILKSVPHEAIYKDFIHSSLKNIHDLQYGFIDQFPSQKGVINFSEENINRYIHNVNCIYPKPLIVLKELLKIKDTKKINPLFIQNLTSSILDSFEYKFITSNSEPINQFENYISDPKDSESSDLSGKMKEAIDTLKLSNGYLLELCMHSFNIHKNIVFYNKPHCYLANTKPEDIATGPMSFQK